MFSITEFDSARAATILHGFIERIGDDLAVFAHHLPRRLTYDSTATLTYQGGVVRGGGAEGSIFHVAKPDGFLIIIRTPATDEFLPSITVAGDIHQAEKFLLAFQMAGGAWT